MNNANLQGSRVKRGTKKENATGKKPPPQPTPCIAPTGRRRCNDSNYTMKGILWPPYNTAHAVSVPRHPHSLARANQFYIFNYILY
jgi:hypothetical protein